MCSANSTDLSTKLLHGCLGKEATCGSCGQKHMWFGCLVLMIFSGVLGSIWFIGLLRRFGTWFGIAINTVTWVNLFSWRELLYQSCVLVLDTWLGWEPLRCQPTLLAWLLRWRWNGLDQKSLVRNNWKFYLNYLPLETYPKQISQLCDLCGGAQVSIWEVTHSEGVNGSLAVVAWGLLHRIRIIIEDL